MEGVRRGWSVDRPVSSPQSQYVVGVHGPGIAVFSGHPLLRGGKLSVGVPKIIFFLLSVL